MGPSHNGDKKSPTGFIAEKEVLLLEEIIMLLMLLLG